MIKAVLFDMDGTLIDTEILYAKALKEVLEQKETHILLEDVVEIVYGRSWQGVYETVEELYPNLFENEKELQTLTTIIFDKSIVDGQFAIEGSLVTLKKLAQEYPIVIVSGSSRDHLKKFIELMSIQDLIQFYVGSDDYYKSKPSPEGYLKAAEQLNLSPENCLVFEDSNPGVLAAKAAGMKCVALKRKGAPEQDVSAADLILKDLSLFDVDFLSV